MLRLLVLFSMEAFKTKKNSIALVKMIEFLKIFVEFKH
jgi:hypothetical protein